MQMNGAHITQIATKNTSDDKYFDRKLKQLEENRYQTDMTYLDSTFIIREINDGIKSSKSGKSSSDDLIII